MIKLIQELLSKYRCKVSNFEKKIIISDVNIENFPEDFIEISKGDELFYINEVHRSEKKLKYETKKEENVIVITVVLATRLYYELTNPEIAESIRKYIKSDEEVYVQKLLEKNVSNDSYSIGREDFNKISFIKSSEKVNIMFHGRYIAKDASLSRAYVVLYNFSKELSFVRELYVELKKKVGFDLDISRIEELYIFGA